MFPEQFVRKHVIAQTEIGDVVLDPFAGRGTTILESLLLGRIAFGTDTNPVAVCLSNAKANSPVSSFVLKRIRLLETRFRKRKVILVQEDEFFSKCFHPSTLKQICFMRESLKWRDDNVDCFIAAMILGCLHGDSNRSKNYLSNQMPRTISTKKGYSVRWWNEHGYVAPDRDLFSLLRDMVGYRLVSEIPRLRGKVVEADARTAAMVLPELRGGVTLVVTSPPYLDTTDYREDQWLRLWFLGGPSEPVRGQGDDRHRSADAYWQFLEEAWAGVAKLLRPGATIVVRIGGRGLSVGKALDNLSATLSKGLGVEVHPLDRGHVSEIINRQTRSFRPGTVGRRVEMDFRFRTAM